MYLKVRRACGIAAVVITAVYVTALRVAAGDGAAGVEVPSEASRAILGAIIALSVTAIGGWIVEGTIEAIIERQARRMVAEEIDRAVDRLSADLHRAIIRAAGAGRAAAVAEVRDMLGEGVREIVESGLQRAEVRGMVREATSRANGANGAAGRATVHALRPSEEN